MGVCSNVGMLYCTYYRVPDGDVGPAERGKKKEEGGEGGGLASLLICCCGQVTTGRGGCLPACLAAASYYVKPYILFCGRDSSGNYSQIKAGCCWLLLLHHVLYACLTGCQTDHYTTHRGAIRGLSCRSNECWSYLVRVFASCTEYG